MNIPPMFRVILMMALLLTGCAHPGQQQPRPLTLAEWEAMPARERFSVESLERLKEGEPRFADEVEWERFLWEVVIPRKHQDRMASPLQ